MPERFFVADLHLGHANIINLEETRKFASIEGHDEAIIGAWNAAVRDDDKVYLLGDACLSRHALPNLGRLRGKKRFIPGNHDTLRMELYMPFFERITSSWEFDGLILTHIPVHDSQVGAGRRYRANVHGHVHSKAIKFVCGALAVYDQRYAPVSLEQTVTGAFAGRIAPWSPIPYPLIQEYLRD